MKSTAIFSFAFVLFAAIAFSSCKKAGLGGEATIVAFPKSGDTPVTGSIIYIKYGTKSFPGDDPSLYDDSKVALPDNGEPAHAHFENLEKGDYYFYGVGFDSTSNLHVTGGIAVTISNKAGETDVVIPLLP